MRPKTEARARARELRQEGRSYVEIATELNVSKSSVSLWVRDLPRPPISPAGEKARREGLQRYFAQRRRRTAIERQGERLRWANALGPLSDRELLIAGAVAYWAEGTKSKPWRPEERLVFVNSDPGLITLFLDWLDLVGVDPDRLRLSVYVHESTDVAAAERFWSEVVQVPFEKFQATVLKRHFVRTNRKNVGEGYHGCLRVSVCDSAALYRRVEGIWWAVAEARGDRVARRRRVTDQRGTRVPAAQTL